MWLGGGGGLGSRDKVTKWGYTDVGAGVRELKACKGLPKDRGGGPVSDYVE